MSNAKSVFEGYLIEGSRQMGINLTGEQISAFKDFYDFLMQENKKYNLTAIKGEKEAAVKHFLDSLACVKFFNFEKKVVVDLGTGPGFPGIPLKIYCPCMKLILLDSIRKKVDFLTSLIEKMGFSGTEALWERAENIGANPRYREKADIVISRAVAPLNVLAELCLPLVKKGGFFIALKGPNIDHELENAKKAVDLMGGIVERVENFILPIIPEERAIIFIQKAGHTPEGYPRRAGIPAKRPIL